MNFKKTLTIAGITIGVVLLLFTLWVVFFFMPIFPHRVVLPSGDYLPAPKVYLQSEVHYDPLRPPLETGIRYISIDRADEKLEFHFQSEETLTVSLGKPGKVKGCEGHYLMEYFQLPVPQLELGPVVVQNPVLMVSCDMWAGGEKIRPAKLILREGPLPGGAAFYMGTQCRDQNSVCFYFGEEYGTLKITVIDGQTGEPAPLARITAENEMGIQEYIGGFDLPLYAGIQVHYQISAAGYPDIYGQISNSYGSKLFIDMLYGSEQLQGYSEILDMPAQEQKLTYAFKLGANPFPPPTPVPSPTSLPTSPYTATPIP